jgi:Mg-chelatase subunit ChlD
MVVSTIEFVHTDPVMWELTARQQTLASRDVKEDITADIMAKVMDALGNPVEGETVTFAIVNPTNTTLLTTPSELVDSMAITDIDGFARILFRPGAFPRWGETGYNDTATGTATVRATWNGRTKDIVITFRNYPYLRVEAEVSPETIRVNETVNVTVRLIGDGWALRPKPIDVLLVTDRSGSMLEDNPDRMVPVKDASKAFAQEMALSQSQDHVGLVSFGESGWANLSPTRYYSHGWHWDWSNVYGSWYWVYRDGYNDCNTGDSYSTSSVHHQYLVTNYGGGNKYYANYADVDISLNWSSSTINNSINSMVPSGGTPMRLGVYKAIKEMNDTGRNSAVKAIIVLSDGDYNWYGDPLARGSAGQTSNPENYPYRTNDQPNTYYWSFSGLTTSEQNLSVYARNHNIRIYAIGYAADISDYGRTTLRTLAESTGGKYYTGTAANIAEIYQTIAGELKTVAGVNTTMNLNFQNVNVTYNNLTTATPGDEVFAYQHVGGESTFVSSWNNSGILPDHVPIPPYANVSPNFGSYTTYNYSFDQSSDWIADPPHLHFAVGNISINQTWQTTFRLKVLKEGSINVFGQGSSVNFDGSEGIYSTNITDTFITAIANMTAEAANQTVLDVAITGTNDDGSGNITEILDIYWNLDYSGNRTVQQDFYYQFSDDNVIWSGSWVHGGSITTGTGPISNVSQTGGIDVRGKSGWMKIKVTAKEQLIGGKYDEDYWPQVIRVGPGDKIYIRIT